MTSPQDPPPTPALDAWYEAHAPRGSDNPTTRLWFPNEAPYVNLDTYSRGPDMTQILPEPDKPTCRVHLGSKIDIGGYLSEMEHYFAAVVDAIRVARWQADRIASEMAAEVES